MSIGTGPVDVADERSLCREEDVAESATVFNSAVAMNLALDMNALFHSSQHI